MQHHARRLCAAILVAFAAAPVEAQGLNEGENLLVTIPPGFALAHQAGNDQQMIEEFIPEGQSLETWQEMITLQVFPALGGTAPEAFLHRMSAAFATACPEGQAGPVSPVAAGAYGAALFIATCPQSPRTEGVESFVAYAIGGQARLYVMQYAWDRRPSEADFEAARAFLASATVCDTTRADAPCPQE